MHYTRTGGDKPQMVLCHGFSDSGECWTSLARALEADYDVYMVDARCHGQSSAPESGNNADAMAVDLGGFVKALGLDAPAVDKRISALALALQMKATVYDLEESELCYAPQFGSAKDPVNFAGMVGADVLRGDMPLAHWDETDDAFLLDVRHPVELVVENVPGAVNIPLHELRARLDELPKDREILVICRSAQRAYYATRVLLQNGFQARNISGGLLSRAMTVPR